MKKLALTILVALTAVSQSSALNYDPNVPASAPLAAATMLDTGWKYDQIDAAFTDSNQSPYSLNLAAPAMFRVTDDFAAGDTFFVYNSGTLIGTSSFYAGTLDFPATPGHTADSAWQNASYSKAEILLLPGSYSLTIQGNGAGGVPAGFYTRLDSHEVPDLPEGGSLMLVLGSVWAGMAAFGIRRK